MTVRSSSVRFACRVRLTRAVASCGCPGIRLGGTLGAVGRNSSCTIESLNSDIASSLDFCASSPVAWLISSTLTVPSCSIRSRAASISARK